MNPLRDHASLRDIQDYVAKLEAERGFEGRPATAQCLKLVEEIGEVCRAVGKLEGQPEDPQGRVNDLGEEAVDSLLMLVAVVNRYDIDLEDAFRRKEERNNTRVWHRPSHL
ncbi:MazG nucleotide pyrophosphohydrolase domain-containing protein [Actinomadura sp. WMMA1423]|uniref:MazG nucleotide pyrophosphohydrolase domain-containing protein n=1 Tax=Actinomadura sp. WMMA1423 TaxID=2591108 RepID=UPI001146783F|nr:MazG nucleotide pyrophosphohydrolase domain-containing protein [Actinomadura sp. WMMA1423]